MSDELITQDPESKKLMLQLAVDTRKFEIDLFWRRSLFFWGFISAAFVGYGALYKKDEPELALFLACFGLVCSVAWALANRGSKYWQESWEQKVHRLERDIFGTSFFAQQEPIEMKNLWLRARRFSVSKLTIALSDFTVLTWLLLIAVDFSLCPPSLYRKTVPIFTVIFCVFMGWAGRSSTPRLPGV